MVMAQTPVLVGSPAVQQAPVNGGGQKVHPFRMASVERLENVLQVQKTRTTSEQQNLNKVLGTGFIRSLYVRCAEVTAANIAAAAYKEDAPYSSVSQIVLHDVNGDLVNVSSGFHLKLLELYGAHLRYPLGGDFATSATAPAALSYTTADPNVFNIVSGTGATGGSFQFWLQVPVAINDRDLRCLVGNQDQAQTYDLRTNIAASGNIYTVAPTSLGTSTQTVYYESRSVPNQFNPDGSQNQVTPNTYGMLHYLLEAVDGSLPAPGNVTHRLQRIGQTLRTIVAVYRQNASRASAEGTAVPGTSGNMPSSIQVKIGDQVLFTEDTAVRRQLMRQRYGFDAPDGVLAWDFIHDFDSTAGAEFGDDWIYSQDITQFMFLTTYPAGFTANAANSLTFLTDDMSIPAGVDPYNV